MELKKSLRFKVTIIRISHFKDIIACYKVKELAICKGALKYMLTAFEPVWEGGSYADPVQVNVVHAEAGVGVNVAQEVLYGLYGDKILRPLSSAFSVAEDLNMPGDGSDKARYLTWACTEERVNS
jgi:hypothetical protein